MLDGAGNPIKTTHYVGAFEYEGDQLSLVHHSEGRVYYNQDSSHVAYHFDLKDHLGNVRVTFSNKPVVLRQVLTMEDERAPEEEQLFEGVAEHRQTLAFHNTTVASSSSPVPNKVATLLPGQQGVGKSLRVQAGDQVHLEVQARYETRPSQVQGLEGVATEVAGVLQRTAAGLESGGASEGLNGAALGGTLATGKEAKPKAYLNYLIFDEDYQLVDQGFAPVSEAAAVGQDNPDAVPETLSLDVPIEQAGYVYTYLSNEAGASRPVYFDDFSVQHASHIVAVNDYYPFGASHDQEGYVGSHNKYQYQGKELQPEIALLDFHARQYDPLLGRMHSIDPQAISFAGLSPYAGMANNPVVMVDPDGEFVIVGMALLGAYLWTSTTEGNLNPTQWAWDGGTWGSLAAGAVVGGLSGGILTYGGSVTVGLTNTIGQAGLTFTMKGLAATGYGAAGFTGGALLWETAAGGSGSQDLFSEPAEPQNLMASLNLNGSYNQQPIKGEYGPNSAYTVRDEKVDWRTLWNEFKTGKGPERSLFLDGHPMVEDLKSSYIVGLAKLKYELNNRQNLIRYNAPFGAVGAMASGNSMTEQFIGGARISIISVGLRRLFIVNDTKNRNSLYLHLTNKNPDRVPGETIPESTTYQRYIWTEKK